MGDAGGAAPMGGAAGDLTGGGAPPGGEAEPGAGEGAMPTPGGAAAAPAPGTPENASVDYRRQKAINEAIFSSNYVNRQYRSLIEAWVTKKKMKVTRRERHSAFEGMFSRGEMAGMKVTMGNENKTINEALSTIKARSSLLTEEQRNKAIHNETQRLLAESSTGR
jgi:hypothetical protein